MTPNTTVSPNRRVPLFWVIVACGCCLIALPCISIGLITILGDPIRRSMGMSRDALSSTAPAQPERIAVHPEATDIIRARQIILVDDAGQARAWLRTVDGAPSFHLLDASGTERARLSLDSAGAPALFFYGQDGQRPAAILKSRDLGESALVFAGANGKLRTSLSWSERTGGGFMLFDSNAAAVRTVMIEGKPPRSNARRDLEDEGSSTP